MNDNYDFFLQVLKDAVRGNRHALDNENRRRVPGLYDLAVMHNVLPLIVDCLCDRTQKAATVQARDITLVQAQRTADFLLLLQSLEQRGLKPVVIKGIVCRALYPVPEQRPSTDEDLLIRPEEYAAYKAALQDYGFFTTRDEGAYEVLFSSENLQMGIEVHKSLFPPDSKAYGNCSRFFEDAAERTEERQIGGAALRTLAPTEHLLFLICHAYKHFLHGGVGIRQICDLALMAEKDGERADWTYIRRACEELHIESFAAALFRVSERHLGFSMPTAFADIEVDESDLLADSLSGGLYGGTDIDRAHSSTLTLEAVEADRQGRKRRGVLHSVFLPRERMAGAYPYLKEHPWLLPVAWSQRICTYLTRKKRPDPVSPARSMRIAKERIELLRQYRIID